MNRKEIPFDGPAGNLPPQAVALVRAYTRTRLPGSCGPAQDPPHRRGACRRRPEGGGGRRRRGFRLPRPPARFPIPRGRGGGRATKHLPACWPRSSPDCGRRGPVTPTGQPRWPGRWDHGRRSRPIMPPSRSGPGPTVGEAIQAALTAGLNRIVAHDPGVRMGDDPEDVHQARVGTRRLRSDLRTFRPLLDPEWVAGLREEAGWYAGLLGAVRDAEVLAERLEAPGRQPGRGGRRRVASLVRRLADDREAARAQPPGGDELPRYAALSTGSWPPAAGRRGLPTAPTWARPPRTPRPRWSAGPGAGCARRCGRCRGSARRRRAPRGAHPGQAHPLRGRGRRPGGGQRASAFAPAVAGVQTVLGDHQDACVTEDWLRNAVALAAPERRSWSASSSVSSGRRPPTGGRTGRRPGSGPPTPNLARLARLTARPRGSPGIR